MLEAAGKRQIVSSFHYSSIYKNSNNHTIFTKSAVHNESNCASEKRGSSNWDMNESVVIVIGKV